jgi:serine/threonine protein kinase
MGRAWRAHDQVIDRDVAVKELILSAAERASLVLRTTREARAAGRLSHPGVVTIHDVTEHDGSPWIVMECIAGRSLATVITEVGTLSTQRWPRSARRSPTRSRTRTRPGSCTGT